MLYRQQRPSRDQLQAMLGKLQSRLDAIESMIDYVNKIPPNGDVATYVTTLNTNFTNAKEAAKLKLQAFLGKMYECMTDKTGNGTNCKDYEKDKVDAITSLTAEADSYVLAESIGFLTKADGTYIQSLQQEASRLREESSKIYSLLGEASPYLGGILDSSPLAIANLTDEYKDDQWLQFEFNSADSYHRSDDDKESVSIANSFGGGFFFFGGHSSYSSQTDTHTHEEKLALSNLKAKGELLRVNIKRPWFKPEVFDDPGLTYVSCMQVVDHKSLNNKIPRIVYDELHNIVLWLYCNKYSMCMECAYIVT